MSSEQDAPGVVEAWLGRLAGEVFGLPAAVRLAGDPAKRRGHWESAELELSGENLFGLLADRVRVVGREVRLEAGAPPRLSAEGVEVVGRVPQSAVDTWLLERSIPLGLELGARGVSLSSRWAGLELGRLETELRIDRGWLALQPTSSTWMGLWNPWVRLLRSRVPLPALPAGAQLHRVRHGQGTITLRFGLDGFDEPVGADFVGRLRRHYGLAEAGPASP